ncbi:MAG: hypothetical protein WC959_11875 [Kiritimatiellales bacterium]
MKQGIILAIAAFITAGSLAAKDIRINSFAHARLADLAPQDGRAEGKPLDTEAMHVNIGDNEANNLSAAAFIMELPDLPEKAALLNAEMAWRLHAVNGRPPNVQLDVFFKNTGSITAADYATPAVFTANRVMTAETPPGFVRVSNDDMLSVLQKNYSSSTPEFKFIVFRLRWTGGEKFPLSDKNGHRDDYTVITQNHGNRAWRPELKLTVTD